MKLLPFLFLVVLVAFCSLPEILACDSLQFDLVWEESTFPELPQTIVYDKQDRPYFYLAHKNGGLKVYQVSDWANPEQVQAISIEAFDGLHVMNAIQQGNYLYLALGNFFGSNQQMAGLGIVDVTNPESITIADYWRTDTIVQGSAIAIAEGDYAYLGAMNQGLMIFDIADKSNISVVSQYVPNIHFPNENPTDIQEPNARGMAIAGDLLYLCYDAGGIRVIDISDKTQPEEISRYINTELLHKAQAYNNIVLDGDLAYVAVDYCGMEILDISNPLAIERTGWWNPWECEAPTNVWLYNDGHTNQLFHDADQNLVFLSAGATELSVVDVSVPEAPVSCGGFGEVPNQQAVWGLEVYQNKVLLTYINAVLPFISGWSGIKVVESANLVNSADQVEEANKPIIVQEPFPNPFREQFQINFALQEASYVEVSIRDIRGRTITEDLAFYIPGNHQYVFDQSTQQLDSGIYFLRISSQNFEINKKLVSLK